MERSTDKMKEMHERLEMEQLVTKMLEVHALEQEVDAEVATCGIWSEPQWHVFKIENLRRVAAELHEAVTIEPLFTNTDGKVTDYKCYFRHRGLYIHCLATEKELHDGNEAH